MCINLSEMEVHTSEWYYYSNNQLYNVYQSA